MYITEQDISNINIYLDTKQQFKKKTPNIVHAKYNTFTVVYHLLMIVILQIMTVYNQYITIHPLLMTIHHC